MLNMDGSSLGNPGTVGFGGLQRGETTQSQGILWKIVN